MIRFLIASLVLSALASCAGVSVKPLSTEELAESHLHGGHHRGDGYIVYLPQVFLMATHRGPQPADPALVPAIQDAPNTRGNNEGANDEPGAGAKNDGEPKSEVIQIGEWEIRRIVLPDYSRPYRVHPYAFLAKTDFDMDFQEGWMMSHAKGTLDDTSIVGLLTEALKVSALTVTPRAPVLGVAAPDVPDIVLFKVVNKNEYEIDVQQVKIGILKGKLQ